MPLNQDQINDFRKTARQVDYQLSAIAALLREIGGELDIYGLQQASDLRQGRVRVGDEYISLELATRRMFIDHYPSSYLELIAVLLSHFTKTRSILGKWLMTRTIMEAIYEHSAISVMDGENESDVRKAKIVRYRHLQVLDFHLNLAQMINEQRWTDDYRAMREYVSEQEQITDEDLQGFPEADHVHHDAGENRKKRANRFQKLSRGFSLPKGPEYQVIYGMVSRLAHGNPLQATVNQATFHQWRELFLVNGIVIRSCTNLLNFINENLTTEHQARLNRRISSLENFYSTRLEPGWRTASAAELGE